MMSSISAHRLAGRSSPLSTPSLSTSPMSASSARLSPDSSPPASRAGARAAPPGRSAGSRSPSPASTRGSPGSAGRPRRSRGTRACPRRSTKMFPGMRVGVVQAVAEHLVEERPQQSHRQRAGRHRRGRDRVVVGDGDAVDLLHHEHATRRQRLVDDAGRRCRRRRSRCSRNTSRTRRLGAVVELAFERGDELVGQSLHTDLSRRFHSPFEDARRPCGAPRRRGARRPRCRAAAP